MYICDICGKEYENRKSYIGHHSSHKIRIKRIKPIIEKLIPIKYCKYCNKEFSDGRKLGGHQSWCTFNPNTQLTRDRIGNAFRDRILTVEHKDKISEARKKYLDDNPGQIPYLLNHSSKESNPEKIFREELEKRNITGWIQEYPVKRFSLDFAFPDEMIDVEIDGSTHLQENVKKKDTERDIILSDLGWKVYRINAKEIKNNLNKIVDDFITWR